MSFSRLPAASALFRLRPSRRVFVAAFLAGLILAWGAASLGAAVPAAGSGRSPRITSAPVIAPAIAAGSPSLKSGYDNRARSTRPSAPRPRLSLRAPAVRVPSSLLSAGSNPSTP
jgi:hypothetical protein